MTTTVFENYSLYAVVDGDTFHAKGPQGTITVRVGKVDAPEKQMWFHKKSGTWQPAECWGPESAKAAKAKLESQPTGMRIESYDIDGNGRHLAYVFLADGTNFNHWLLEQGHAAIYKGQKERIPEDDISWAAREAKRGMWGKCSGPGHNGRLPMAPVMVEPTPEPEPEPEPATCPTCGQLWPNA